MTDKAELLTVDDVWNDDGIMGANALTGLAIHAMMPLVRAIEAAILRKLAEQPTVYIRRDQLQQAMAAPFLCDVGPAPRQDKVPLYAAPVPRSE